MAYPHKKCNMALQPETSQIQNNMTITVTEVKASPAEVSNHTDSTNVKPQGVSHKTELKDGNQEFFGSVSVVEVTNQVC